MKPLFVILLVCFFLVSIFSFLKHTIKKRKKISILELAINTNLPLEKRTLLREIERFLNYKYSLVVLQDDIKLDVSKFYFPKDTGYIRSSDLNKMFFKYADYLNEEMSKSDFRASLQYFIGSKIFFVLKWIYSNLHIKSRIFIRTLFFSS